MEPYRESLPTCKFSRLLKGLLDSAVGTILLTLFGLRPRVCAEPGRSPRRAEGACVALVPLVVLLAWSSPLPAAELELDPGKEHAISATQATCFEDRFEEPEDTIAEVETRCSVEEGTADVKVVASGVLRAGNFSATAGFHVNFKVRQAREGEAHRSFVPIQVFLPLKYAARVRNDAVTGAVAEFQISLRLRSFAGDQGEVPVVTVLHNGVGDCLTIPTSKIEFAEAVVKCALAVQQLIDVEASSISLFAIVETGRPYELELRMDGSVAKGVGLAEFLAVRSGRCGAGKPNCFPPDEPGSTPGLFWRTMLVTIGTDPAALVADLGDQIDELREALKAHTHTYLTGRGQGHNNTVAVSSPAIIPATSTGARP